MFDANGSDQSWEFDPSSDNRTTDDGSIEHLPYDIPATLVIAVVIGVAIVVTIVGNVLVCLAVFTVRKLRQPPNYLLVSLAMADMLVGLVVMPFAGLYQLFDVWLFGELLCMIWTCSDVLLCTASILNLCAISVDRYWCIVKPLEYGPKRTHRRILFYILLVWTSAFLISVLPQFAFSSEPHWRQGGNCNVNPTLGYQIYATFGAFYIPSALMLLVNYKIYCAAKRIARVDRRNSPGHLGNTKLLCTANITMNEQMQPLVALATPERDQYQRVSSILMNGNAVVICNNNSLNCNGNNRNSSSCASTDMPVLRSRSSVWSRLSRISLRIEESLRNNSFFSSETKATKTLVIIMGAFIVCWLPFFILALIKPICGASCHIPSWLDDTILWMGYINSTLNPIIYAKYNRDFRIPFREMLCCRCHTLQEVLRSDMYAQVYGNKTMTTVT